MKRILAAAALVLGIGQAAVAGEGMKHDGMKHQDMKTSTDTLKSDAAMKADKHASSMGMSGQSDVQLTVKEISKADNTVTFQATVKPEASIMKEGQTMRMEDLKEGDQVRASFDPTTGDVTKLELSGSDTMMKTDPMKKKNDTMKTMPSDPSMPSDTDTQMMK